MHFLTQGDAEKEDVVLSLWHDNLKLLVITDGEKGCRYYTKVREYLELLLVVTLHLNISIHVYTLLFFPFLHILNQRARLFNMSTS